MAAPLSILAYLYGGKQVAQQVRPFLSRSQNELRSFEQKYGPTRHSQYAEEWLIRDFFQDERDGVFVDVGANHYQQNSNTYYLETALGWSGIAVEPQTKFADDYKQHRPRTRFVPLFVSDKSNEKAVLLVPDNDALASTSQQFIDQEHGKNARPMEVSTATLDDILISSEITRLDFASIDVELHEPEVLRGFSIEKWQPRLVCIESHDDVRQQILDYFDDHNYRLIGKYLRADTENLWFTPKAN